MSRLLLPGCTTQIMRLIGGCVGRDAREMAWKINKIGLNEAAETMSDEETLGKLDMIVAQDDLALSREVVFFDKEGGIIKGQIAIGGKGFSKVVIEGDASSPRFARLHAIAQCVAPRESEKSVLFIDGMTRIATQQRRTGKGQLSAIFEGVACCLPLLSPIGLRTQGVADFNKKTEPSQLLRLYAMYHHEFGGGSKGAQATAIS